MSWIVSAVLRYHFLLLVDLSGCPFSTGHGVMLWVGRRFFRKTKAGKNAIHLIGTYDLWLLPVCEAGGKG